MTVTIRVEGLEEVRRALHEYGDVAERALDEESAATAQRVRSEAVRSIQRGPKSGRTYPPIRGRRGSPHTASAAGQPPATDTGTLVRSIAAERGSDGVWSVGTSIRYGKYLEFGTQQMAERPWLRPAARRAFRRFAARVVARLRRVSVG